jgi:hypothetical protein
VCGNAKDVKTWTFELDGKAYEIDLCRKDGNALGRVTAGYIAKARKVTARSGQRQHGGRSRVRTAGPASGDSAKASRAKASGRGRVAGSAPEEAGTDRSEQQAAAVSEARSSGEQPQKGIYVYGILPADIEVAAGIPGVGEDPGLLHDVRLDGLAALVSEVNVSAQLGSPDDLRTYREILDATASEVPILPLHFGTVLTSEDAVAEELLAANHDEFAAALDRLEGRAEFQIRGRYVEDAILAEVLSENKQAARLRETIQGKDPDAARNARIELDQLISEAVAARREEDTRAVQQAMEGVSVASVAREPARELGAVHVAFLVDVDREREVERVIEDLAREWEGRIDIQLLGPMAAYDFTGRAEPEG